jgi:hypothetical protein
MVGVINHHHHHHHLLLLLLLAGQHPNADSSSWRKVLLFFLSF